MGLLVAIAATAVSLTSAQQTSSGPFQLEETTIAQIHAALKSRQLTCRGLVEQYLKRIEAFDKAGPAINAIVEINKNALADADALDRRASQGALSGPLHCIPAIVKDNFETIGLQSCRRLAVAQRLRLEPRCLPGQAHQGGWRDRARQVEHGRVRVFAVRDRQLDPAGLLEESVRARPGDRGLERRHRRRRCREFRRDWPRQ